VRNCILAPEELALVYPYSTLFALTLSTVTLKTSTEDDLLANVGVGELVERDPLAAWRVSIELLL